MANTVTIEAQRRFSMDRRERRQELAFRVLLILVVVLKVIASLLVLVAQYSGKVSSIEALLLLR